MVIRIKPSLSSHLDPVLIYPSISFSPLLDSLGCQPMWFELLSVMAAILCRSYPVLSLSLSLCFYWPIGMRGCSLIFLQNLSLGASMLSSMISCCFGNWTGDAILGRECSKRWTRLSWVEMRTQSRRWDRPNTIAIRLDSEADVQQQHQLIHSQVWLNLSRLTRTSRMTSRIKE